MALWISLIIIGGTLAIDLISKAIVAGAIGDGRLVHVIPMLFDFQYVENKGAAFSFLSNWEHSRIFFIILTTAALIAFVYILLRYGKKSKVMSVAFALIIAGALGNLVDRIALHYVRDFIRFAFWDSFATFNIADCALTIGVVLFAIYYIFLYKEPPKKANIGGAKDEKIDGKDDRSVPLDLQNSAVACLQNSVEKTKDSMKFSGNEGSQNSEKLDESTLAEGGIEADKSEDSIAENNSLAHDE